MAVRGERLDQEAAEPVAWGEAALMIATLSAALWAILFLVFAMIEGALLPR